MLLSKQFGSAFKWQQVAAKVRWENHKTPDVCLYPAEFQIPLCIQLLAYKKRIIISKFFSRSNKTKGVLIADHLIRSGWNRNSVPVFLHRASLCGKKCSSDWWIRRNRSAPSTSTKGERQLSYRSSSAPRRSSKTLFAQWRATRANKGNRLFLSKPIWLEC